jgi:hypothetical protein
MQQFSHQRPGGRLIADLLGGQPLGREQGPQRLVDAASLYLDHRLSEAELDDRDVPAHVAELVRALRPRAWFSNRWVSLGRVQMMG